MLGIIPQLGSNRFESLSLPVSEKLDQSISIVVTLNDLMVINVCSLIKWLL
jgi:hypothetical protein